MPRPRRRLVRPALTAPDPGAARQPPAQRLARQQAALARLVVGLERTVAARERRRRLVERLERKPARRQGRDEAVPRRRAVVTACEGPDGWPALALCEATFSQEEADN